MRRVNPDTLEVEEVDTTPYVYVLSDSGSWDYEQTSTIEVFKNFDKALAKFKAKVKDAKHDLREWCDEEDLEEDYEVNRTEERACYSGYESDDYDKMHCEIYIEKKEVI